MSSLNYPLVIIENTFYRKHVNQIYIRMSVDNKLTSLSDSLTIILESNLTKFWG